MQNCSIVYKNISLYRFIMNVIYGGSYRARFELITRFVANNKISSVLELCFGDIIIAEYCKQRNINWKGIDINPGFTEYAKKKGYDATCQDVLLVNSFHKSDICIMAGSLYHFKDHLDDILKKVFEASPLFLISEPVKNLSSRKGLIGYIARHSANIGKGAEEFRFNKQTFEEMLSQYSKKFNFEYQTLGHFKKDIVVVLNTSS